MFCGVTNHASLFGSQMAESGFGGCWENVTCLTALFEFCGGGIMVWGCFSGFGLGPLSPVKGNLNGSAHQYILDNAMLPTMWQEFGEGPFLYQHDCAPVHKARTI